MRVRAKVKYREQKLVLFFGDARWVDLPNNPEMISRMYIARKAETTN